ncbi:MAG: hypothetical protein EA424_10770 [Planctomycetaceae bacterium]|nr:MAG: hypothetical protein EA424_10770 [Planctomycetaceae bacterium]
MGGTFYYRSVSQPSFVTINRRANAVPNEFRNDGGKQGGSFSSERKSVLQKTQNLAKNRTN